MKLPLESPPGSFRSTCAPKNSSSSPPHTHPTSNSSRWYFPSQWPIAIELVRLTTSKSPLLPLPWYFTWNQLSRPDANGQSSKDGLHQGTKWDWTCYKCVIILWLIAIKRKWFFFPLWLDSSATCLSLPGNFYWGKIWKTTNHTSRWASKLMDCGQITLNTMNTYECKCLCLHFDLSQLGLPVGFILSCF